MSLFLPSIPQASDNLDFSQGQLLSNNGGLDTVFGIDHYDFSNPSANKGFHNKVTTPSYVANPATGLPPVTVANPIFYGFQQTAPMGIIQYSRGPNDAVPTPLTRFHSTAAPLTIAAAGTVPILDFTGLTSAYAKFYAYNSSQPGGAFSPIFLYEGFVGWNGSTFIFTRVTTSNFVLTSAGGTLFFKSLDLVNAAATVFWSLEMIRAQ